MKKSKKSATKIELGYVIVASIAVLAVVTVSATIGIYNKFQDSADPVEPLATEQIGELPLTGGGDFEKPNYECDELSEGKEQEVDSIVWVCESGEWIQK
jgi:hypothetical protein